MKAGTENRKAIMAAAILAPLALLLAWNAFRGGDTSPAPAPPATVGTAPAAGAAANPTPAPSRPRRRGDFAALGVKPQESLDPTLRLDLLAATEKTGYERSGRNIFRMGAAPRPDIPAAERSPLQSKAPVETGTPSPPPINLRFFGFATRQGEGRRIFLSEDGDVFIASEGDIVNRRYRILRITNSSVEVEDVLNNNRQTIPLSAG